ncbi:MAG TPA: hypothetical protein VHM16_01305 [Rubrobacteraceae bacterium]|nr:hypothetical protein [Rubrobacteraceae bacterium]
MATTEKILPQSAGATAHVRPRVLVANDPGAYRDAISTVLSQLRPGVEVLAAVPKDLDDEYARLQPSLTVCSRLTRVVESGVSDWIELYPDGASVANFSVGGERSTLARPDFGLILSLVDRLLPQP